LALALFFPVHQTYGQLCGTLYFATDRTRQYRNIGIALMPVGALVTYILLAPHDYLIPGMGLASFGLALQLVFVNMISVNILLFLNCRYMKIQYRKFIYHQIFVILILLTTVIASRLLCSSILNIFSLGKGLNEWLLFFSSGILYTAVSISIAYSYPEILGLSRNEILGHVNNFKKYFSPE
jgi:hypothetical protein